MAAPPPRNTPFLTCTTVPNFVRFRLKGMNVITEMRLKNLTPRVPRPAFQNHSRSSEPTRIDQLPMTSY